MKRLSLVIALLLASCSTASTAPPATAAEAGLCPETIEEYCNNVGGCRVTWASAIAQCNATSQLFTCGALDHAGNGPHNDYYDHATGALVGIVQTGGQCLAGVAGFQPPTCSPTTPIACAGEADASTLDGGDGG